MEHVQRQLVSHMQPNSKQIHSMQRFVDACREVSRITRYIFLGQVLLYCVRVVDGKQMAHMMEL